jgi:3-oxoacyl-[acyl-carrier protein] reductase
MTSVTSKLDIPKGLTGEHGGQIAQPSPLHRGDGVEDVAAAVEYLVSDTARNITGTVITVEGGIRHARTTQRIRSDGC